LSTRCEWVRGSKSMGWQNKTWNDLSDLVS
jgi:hypothetical protein